MMGTGRIQPFYIMGAALIPWLGCLLLQNPILGRRLFNVKAKNAPRNQVLKRMVVPSDKVNEPDSQRESSGIPSENQKAPDNERE